MLSAINFKLNPINVLTISQIHLKWVVEKWYSNWISLVTESGALMDRSWKMYYYPRVAF